MLELDKIRQAVARGWTVPPNTSKVMDVDLVEAIAIEIFKEQELAIKAYQASTRQSPYLTR